MNIVKLYKGLYINVYVLAKYEKYCPQFVDITPPIVVAQCRFYEKYSILLSINLTLPSNRE